MEIYIVQILYLFRPILNAELVDWGLLGFNFFELLAILLFLALVAAFALGALQKKRNPVSRVEVWAVLLIVWITISYVVHVDISSLSTYAKLVIPLMTYVMLKRILPDRAAHIRLVFLMLIGFLLPLIMSAVMTYQGEGLRSVSYWTGLERYTGVYRGSHSMAHNAGFAMMLTAIYFALRKGQPVPLRRLEILVLATVFVISSYLMSAAHIRNVYLGVAIFFVVMLYHYDKRVLAFFVLSSVAFLAYSWSTVSLIFFDFLDPPELREGFIPAGSGRLTFWTWALENWRQAPLLNQLTGMGVKIPEVSPTRQPIYDTYFDGTLRPWPDPHSDILFILLSLGLIGLALFVGLFGSILRAILNLRGNERLALLALFVAVIMMNAMSNAYITRFQLAQMFFMVMVYLDLRPVGTGDRAGTPQIDRRLGDG